MAWQEQRDFITVALAALGNHPLAAIVRKELSLIKPARPDTTGYSPVAPSSAIALGPVTLSFDDSGAIVRFTDAKGKSLL